MKKLFLILFIIISILYNGCLKDSSISPIAEDTNYSKVFLKHFEAMGDYINSAQMPSLITASELHNNLGNDLILDVSSASQFSEGHIPGSVNILSSGLFNYVNSTSTQRRVVLVSRTGQAASYYTGLLRLGGFNNIYALKFGMAGWNSAFSGYWNSNVSINDYTNLTYDRPPYSKLPEIKVDNPAGEVKNNLILVIQKLLAESFNEYLTSEASVDFGYLSTIYHAVDSTFTDTFIMNVGNVSTYYLGPNGILENPGHPPRAVLYYEYSGGRSDLRSTSYLQTIPSDKNIIVYTKYGHSSAFIVAYLKLLGYKAKSLLFGSKWRDSFPGSADFTYDTGN